MRAAAHYFATSAEKEEIGHILVRRPATAFAAGAILRKKMPRHFTQHVSLYGIARRPERAARDTQNGEQKMKTPHIGAFIISPARYTGLYGGDDRTRICDLLHVKQAL